MPTYLPTVRAAQDLAGLLKQCCPEVHAQIDALQAVVTQSHARLDLLSSQWEAEKTLNKRDGRSINQQQTIHQEQNLNEANIILKELESAYKSLLELKHRQNRLQNIQR